MSTTVRDRDQVFLSMAKVLGELGTCDRAHVGAIITKQGRCISWGYNGAPPGFPHCEENEHGHIEEAARRYPKGPNRQSQEWLAMKIAAVGCINVTHAEANAICFAARQGISTAGCTMYVERSPCANCARLIIAAGVGVVVTSVLYRDTAGWEMLADALIERRLIDV